jgi:hypothetical protein
MILISSITPKTRHPYLRRDDGLGGDMQGVLFK